MTIHVGAKDSQGRFSLIEVEASRGRTTPWHQDPNCETFHILEGELEFGLDGRQRRASRGETIVVPEGLPHAFIVRSEHARFLVVNAPAGDSFFRDGGQPAVTGEPPAPSPSDRQRWIKAAKRNGIVILGPPALEKA